MSLKLHAPFAIVFDESLSTGYHIKVDEAVGNVIRD